jgi:hypothetical protein
VQVRSKEEILATLDDNAELAGMPFMPEMLPFCGDRFQVVKRAHKTCDTVFPIRSRRVERAVHLATRCDGRAHGGCQAGCLLFWKEAWLKPVNAPARDEHRIADPERASVTEATTHSCAEAKVWSCAQRLDPADGAPVYACQATRLPYATSNLAWWDIRQYVEDYTSGNVTLKRLLAGLVYSAYYHLCQAGVGLGRPMRWLYNKLSFLWRGGLFPRASGLIPDGQPTPTVALDLQPGDVVRVKQHRQILETITTSGKNRGLSWDAEMTPYCGGSYRVLKRVTRIVDEKTGRLQQMKTPCIILDSVTCEARYSGCRMFCPRGLYPFWREVWLERLEHGAEVPPGPAVTP